MSNNVNGLKKLKSNSTLAIAAGCAVAFMFIMTIVSVIFYMKSAKEVNTLSKDSNFQKFDYYVAFITSDDSNDYYTSVYRGAKEYGLANGIYVDMLSDSINEDYTKYELMEQAIDAGCDGIIVEGDDSDEMAALMKKAYNKAIDVVTIQEDVRDSQRLSYVGVNNYSVAQLYASQLSECLEEETEVLILESAESYESSTGILVTGIQEAVAQQIADLDLDNVVTYNTLTIDNSDAFSTEEFVRDYFQTNELPDVIICLDELSTTCVYQALIDYNKVGEVKLLGYYQSATIFEGIRQQVIKSTVAVDTKNMGKSACMAIDEYFKTGFTSDYYGINAVLVDQTNVKSFMEEEALDE